MRRDFKQAKDIIQYLERRYGSIKKHTINDDITMVSDICDDHSSEEIKMMRNRINALIQSKRDMSYVNNHPMNLLIAFFTTVGASVLAMVTIVSQTLISYIGQVTKINDEEVTQEILNQMVSSLDFSSIMSVAIKYIILIFILLSIGIYFINIFKQRYSNIFHMYGVLIEEAFEKKRETENI